MNSSLISAALGVKGVIDAGTPSRINYLVKTNALGVVDASLLPFDVTSELTETYFIDAVLGDDVAGTGSIISPFATIGAALAFNAGLGGTPMALILGRGTHGGTISITNANQTEVSFISWSPLGATVSSQITNNSAATTILINLVGVAVGTVYNGNAGAAFTARMLDGATASAINNHAGAAIGTLVIYPGSTVTSVTRMTKVYKVNAEESNYTMTTPADWLTAPVLVSTALDELGARVTDVETELGDNVMKLDGSSMFKDAAVSCLFKIGRKPLGVGFQTTLASAALTADVTVTIPNRLGILPVVDDLATGVAGDVNATWSVTKLVSALVAKAGSTMTGPLVLDDTSLQIQEGADTLTITAPVLTGARAVTFGDFAGEVTLKGNAFNARNQLVCMSDEVAPKLPAIDGSQLTGLTNTQVGLGNVTNDAQLTRGAGDFAAGGFIAKTAVANADRALIEDATAAPAYSKKYITLGDLIPTAVNLGSVDPGATSLFTTRARNEVSPGVFELQLQFKTLIAGAGIGFTTDANHITITADENTWTRASCARGAATDITVGNRLQHRGIKLWFILSDELGNYRNYEYSILCDGTSIVAAGTAGETYDLGTFPETSTPTPFLSGDNIQLRLTLSGSGAAIMCRWRAERAPLTAIGD